MAMLDEPSYRAAYRRTIFRGSGRIGLCMNKSSFYPGDRSPALCHDRIVRNVDVPNCCTLSLQYAPHFTERLDDLGIDLIFVVRSVDSDSQPSNSIFESSKIVWDGCGKSRGIVNVESCDYAEHCPGICSRSA